MNISEIAHKTGLTSKAIRFYEEKALITAPMRGDNGYRYYQQKHIDELMLLRQAKEVGFTLEECRELLRLFHNPRRHSADVKNDNVAKSGGNRKNDYGIAKDKRKITGIGGRMSGR